MAQNKRFIAKNGLDNNNQTITNVANPSNATDVVNKQYLTDSDHVFASTTANTLGNVNTGAIQLDGGIGIAGNATIGGDVHIQGSVTINGTTTTINTATLTVDDKLIEIGSVASPSDITADGGGIVLKGATDKTIVWDNANDNWTSSESWNLVSGKDYKINNVSVLNATTLGSSVVSSSLTSLGTLSSLSTSGQITSSVTTGTAPFVVASTTAVSNLNADMVDGKHVGTSGNTIPLLDGANTWSGIQLFADGAVGTPSISNADDTNTGVWFPAADTIAISTGGVERLRVTDTAVTVNALTIKDSDDSIVSDSTVASWIYDKEYSVSAQETEPRDLSFSSDGTKLYILGNAGNDITQFALSTPWDVSTATFTQVFSVATQDGVPYGLYFKPDGSKFYMCGTTADSVYEYNVGTPWDISTSSYVQAFSVTAKETDPNSVVFSTDGTKMYVSGTISDSVHQYNLGTAWNISTAVFGSTLSVATYETIPQGLDFTADGTKFYVIGTTYNRIVEYTLSTPWDISTGTFSGYTSAILPGANYASGISGIYISTAQNKVYFCDYTTDKVFQFVTNVPATKLSGSKFLVDADTHFQKDLLVYNNINCDSNLYVRSSITTPGNATISGTLDVRVAIDLADNDILRLGSSDDIEIYHNAVDNIIDMTVGNLLIRDDATAGDPTRFAFMRSTGALIVNDGVDDATGAVLQVEGAITVENGSTSLPSYSNRNDANTGVWFPAADTIAISVGGTERFRVDSSWVTISNGAHSGLVATVGTEPYNSPTYAELGSTAYMDYEAVELDINNIATAMAIALG